MSPTQIFLSYSRDDILLMQRLRDDLRAAGFTVWTDEAIQPGSPSWKLEIEGAIRQSDCLLVIFSPDAAESRWVRAEIDFAETLKKPLFSVLARGDETNAVPFGMTTHQWIDLRDLGRYDSGMALLMKTLRAQTGNQATGVSTVAPVAPPIPPAIKHQSRRLRLGLLGVAVLLALGVGGLLMWTRNSPQPTATISISTSDEWTERRSGDITLSVPASWNKDIDPSFASDLVNQTAGDPEKAEAFLAAIPQDYEFFIGDWSQLIVFGVIVQDLPVRLSLDVLRERSTQLYSLINIEVIESEIEDFTAGEMLRIVAQSRNPEVSGGNIVYYLFDDKTLYYTVFFVGSTDDLSARIDSLLPITDRIMDSFQLSDS